MKECLTSGMLVGLPGLQIQLLKKTKQQQQKNKENSGEKEGSVPLDLQL